MYGSAPTSRQTVAVNFPRGVRKQGINLPVAGAKIYTGVEISNQLHEEKEVVETFEGRKKHYVSFMDGRCVIQT